MVRFIKTRQVLAMIGVSRTTLWRMVQEGTFPRPVQVTGRNAHYLLQAVEAWMRARAEGLPWQEEAAAPVERLGPQGRQPRLALARHMGTGQGQ
jgi:prophage regulatory protein